MEEKVKKHMTIRREMFLLSFAIVIALSLLFPGLFLHIVYENNLNSAKNALKACNSQIVTYIEGVFHENATIAEILSRDPLIINATKEERTAVIEAFNAIQKRNRNITYLYSGYADGSLFIDNYPIPVAFDATTRPWYLAAVDGVGVVQIGYRDAATDVWLFSQSIQLVDETGKATGVLALDSSNDSIFEQLSTKYQYDSQRSFIVDEKGVVLIHPVESEINTTLQEVMSPAAWNAIVEGDNKYAEYENLGKKAMAYAERIEGTDFFALTAIDASEVTRPIEETVFHFFALVVLISTVLGYILSYVLIQRFARPIIVLSSRIQNLAIGRLDKPASARFYNKEINGIADNIEIIVHDIATREEQRKTAEYLSMHDSMTGLYNRRFFEEALQSLDAPVHYPLCILACDINGLKLTNDVFGHATGDKLIIATSETLKKNCDPCDILARMGGDEFMLIFPNTGEAAAKKKVLDIKNSFLVSGVDGAEVSASLGYAIKSQENQRIAEILKAADRMMYEEKLQESLAMKRRTVFYIISTAENEDLVKPLSKEEEGLLNAFAQCLCPEQRTLLKESYQLRRLGLCSLMLTPEYGGGTLKKRHAENGYRVLSALDEYRNVAGCILHYMERWDGGGWPANLTGQDIPLVSRIIALVDTYMAEGCLGLEREGQFDPELLLLLDGFLDNSRAL